MWVEVPELLANCYRPLMAWRKGVNKSVHFLHIFLFFFFIPSVKEYNRLDSKCNKIVIILYTPKSSLSKIRVQPYTAKFNCIRYRSFSGDKNINYSINEGFHFVKEYFILKVDQPITLCHEFQNYGQ